MIAAGAYIRSVREGRGMTRAELASLLETTETQLFRVESGQQDTRGSSLMRIVSAIGANIKHVYDLLMDESSTAEDGQRLAMQWLSRDDRAMLDSIPDEQIQEVVRILDEMKQRDSTSLDMVLRMLRGLRA